MSELIPEKGVCRIVFESIDKDDYCLDAEAESDTEQSQSENSCEEDNTCQINGYWKDFNKKGMLKRIEFSSESECDDPKKRKITQQFQIIPDFSNLLNNNTIQSTILNQHQDNLMENVTITSDNQINDVMVSKSFLKMTEALQTLSEIQVLPNVNQTESNVFKSDNNVFDTIKIIETNSICLPRNPCSSSQVYSNSKNSNNSLRSYRKHKKNSKNSNNSLRSYRKQKRNCQVVVDVNDQSKQTIEVETKPTTPIANPEKIKNTMKNKEAQFPNVSDDEKDFNMAVEALNLLRNNRRNNCDPELSQINSNTLTIDEGYGNKSLEVASLPNSITANNPIEILPSAYCTSSEMKQELIFDSTLEITDCSTGAKIPFETIYHSANEFFKNGGKKFSSYGKQNQIQIEENITPSTLAQLSITCTKVPLHKSVLAEPEQELGTKRNDFRNPEQSQIPDGQTHITVFTDASFKISKECETTQRRENDYTSKSSTHSLSQNISNQEQKDGNIQQITELSNTSVISSEMQTGNVASNLKFPQKLLTKKLPLEPRLREYKEQTEDKRTNYETTSSNHQTSKTAGSYLEFSSSLFENNFNTPTPNGANKQTNKDENRNEYADKEIQTPQKISTRYYSSKIKTPLDAFNLFINNSMIMRIVEYTNEKILEEKNAQLTGKTELEAFIGLLLISAALKQNKTIGAELWSECFGASIYRATLKESRFYFLLQKFCIGNITSANNSNKKNVLLIGDPLEQYYNNCKLYRLPIETKTKANEEDEACKHLYTTARKTSNQSIRVFCRMLDVAVLKGSAIFQYKFPKNVMNIQRFYKQVGLALVTPHLDYLLQVTSDFLMKELIKCILSRRTEDTNKVVRPVADQVLKKQKRCQLCSWNKDRKTKHQCSCCRRNMCSEHRAEICIQCIKSI
ncbi:uncharacterized protein LOC129915938 isoform X2 [Episyrphus balteatus]|uniref:uncharacterized protein LOC129915938 isoform X2 n=1 Tax=Episyrphus balteatus TaxID=286459 RepID=UPI0024863AF4|nr:uncharacterized protein LOC129915938 isoform X2 [Episyrphus balteatus]